MIGNSPPPSFSLSLTRSHVVTVFFFYLPLERERKNDHQYIIQGSNIIAAVMGTGCGEGGIGVKKMLER